MFRILAVSMTLAVSPCLLFAQEPPNEKQLAEGIAEKLPAWMGVDRVEITASANSGDTVSPLIRNRLIALVSNREDLYQQVYLPEALREFAPEDHELIRVMTEANTSVSLYGISQSYLSMGSFRTDFEFENIRSINDLGKPKDFFKPSALVIGSEEQVRFYADIQERADKEEARLEDLRTILSEQLPGEWKGEYVCGQGTTGLTVTIKEFANLDEILGVFHFYGIERSASDVPDGKYEIIMSYDDTKDIIVAQPRAWIDQPFGYNMVGFSARLSENEIQGTIDSWGCGSLKLNQS